MKQTPDNLIHYEGKRPESRLLLALIFTNATFAVTTIFWWGVMASVIAEPVRWATWRGLGQRPEMFEYPFVLLWLLPIGGICAGWVAYKAERVKLAKGLAFFPVLFLGLVLGWYYVTPVHWQ